MANTRTRYREYIGRRKQKSRSKKNVHAVALGHLGGVKGGPARARSISKERRKAIATEGARARWAFEKHQVGSKRY